MAANVSAELLARMEEAGDEPMEDSEFVKTASGATIERVEGQLARWTSSNVSGDWVTTADYKRAAPGAT